LESRAEPAKSPPSAASNAVGAPSAVDQGAAAVGKLAVRPPPVPQTSPAPGMRDQGHDARRPAAAEWIERIRALRDGGKANEAVAELRRFRNAFDHADEQLPPDLRAWAASLR
jgi:hypothetical protein